MDDYYSILELNKNCSKEDIKKKYHRLSLKYHPDKNEGGNSERFRRITDAYKILYDDDRRKLYDIKLLFKDIDLTEEDYQLLCSYYNSLPLQMGPDQSWRNTHVVEFLIKVSIVITLDQNFST